MYAKLNAMKSLDLWLKEQPGRASRLAEVLAVSRSHLSQVRSRLRRLPVDWMPVIEDFSGGILTVEAMVLEQSRGLVNARRERRRRNGSVT